MKKETILEFINSTKPGTFQKMISETQITEDLIKRVESVIKVGILNKNRKEILEKNKIINDKLPYGSYLIDKYIIEHTNKNNEYNLYLRYYTTHHKAKVKYFYKGQEVTKQYLIDNKIVSESKIKSNDSSVRNINIKNIIRLGNFA